MQELYSTEGLKRNLKFVNNGFKIQVKQAKAIYWYMQKQTKKNSY